jgi:hypothetical protein
MTNIETVKNFITEQVKTFNNEGENYTEIEKYNVTPSGVTYKNAMVITINFREGTVFSRMQFGSNKSDAMFLRRLVRSLPEIIEKPKEII